MNILTNESFGLDVCCRAFFLSKVPEPEPGQKKAEARARVQDSRKVAFGNLRSLPPWQAVTDW
jgi:hypothetical protein